MLVISLWLGLQIEIFDELAYSPGSMDNIRKYPKAYLIPDHFEANAKFGVICSDLDGIIQNSVFITATRYDKPYENSALIQGGVLYLAIGNQVYNLSLPDLNLFWYQEVDPGSCFGIYFSNENQ